MAIIKTSTDFEIDSGENKYTIYKRTDKLGKDGKPIRKFCGDYVDFHQCLENLFKLYVLDKVNKMDVWDLKDVIQMEKDMWEDFKSEFKLK